MLPHDRAQPAARDKPSFGSRILRAQKMAPTWLKVLVIAAAVLFFPVTLGLIILAALVYAVVSVVQGRRTAGASASVAVWGVAAFSALYSGNRTWLYALLLLPVAVAFAAHARPLARWFVPCRTVAWVLLWSVPVGAIALRVWPKQPLIGTVAAWVLAAAVLGWRVAKGVQDARMRGPVTEAGRSGPGPAASTATTRRLTRAEAGASPATRAAPRTGSGPRPRRCPTPSTPGATTRPARRGSARRSRSRTPWRNWTR